YLFLCPPEEFQIGPAAFRWPDRPAYWSFDPSGAEPLSNEDAAHLGFPVFYFSCKYIVRHWRDSTYTALRQFHQAKGFDPYSQDMARSLGYHLYKL
ncbi:hypothetical protein DFH07DRAFT_703650, partial [Mycena maculata]